MKITDDCLVTLEYTLKDDNQEILDSSEQMGPLDYVHGYRQLIPGLEKALQGREAGESFSLTVTPQQAYGEIDPRAVFEVSRAQFPPHALSPVVSIHPRGRGEKCAPSRVPLCQE